MNEHLNLPWVECPTFEVDFGKKIPDRFKGMPQNATHQAQELLRAIINEIPTDALKLATAVRIRTANRFHQEAVALADVASADWRQIVLASISYELILSVFGCSTIVLPTCSGPVVARNMDWWPEDILAQSSYLIRAVDGNRLLFANAGWPGSIGVVSGLSGRGFAVVLNAVMSPEGIDRLGYPVLLHIRRVLEDARDFNHALKLLSKQRLAASALLTLVGIRNEERVVIERSPKRHALRWGEPGKALIATNDYRELFATETHDHNIIYETTCTRFDALCDLCSSHNEHQNISDEELLYVLSDPSVIQSITAQHVIMRPWDSAIRLFVPRRLVSQ